MLPAWLFFLSPLWYAWPTRYILSVFFSPIEDRPQPDPSRARTGHKLIDQESKVLKQLIETKLYADQNKLKINFSITKLMQFNRCYSKDFLPSIEFDNTPIELVEQTKLLGLNISSDLFWNENADYILDRCNKKLCMGEKLY